MKVTKSLKLLMHREGDADKIPDQTPLALTHSCSSHGQFSPSKLFCSDTMEDCFKGILRKVYWVLHHVKGRAVGSCSSPVLSTVLQWAAQPLGVTACTDIFHLIFDFKKANSLLSILPHASVSVSWPKATAQQVSCSYYSSL